MLLEVLRTLEILPAMPATMRLHRHMHANVRRDMITLDRLDSAIAPLAVEIEVVCRPTSDMLLAEVLLQQYGQFQSPNSGLRARLIASQIAMRITYIKRLSRRGEVRADPKNGAIFLDVLPLALERVDRRLAVRGGSRRAHTQQRSSVRSGRDGRRRGIGAGRRRRVDRSRGGLGVGTHVRSFCQAPRIILSELQDLCEFDIRAKSCRWLHEVVWRNGVFSPRTLQESLWQKR